MFCREYLAQLREYQQELEDLDIQVIIITLSKPHFAEMWRKDTGINYPLYFDIEKRAYNGFGFRRSFWQVWNLVVGMQYVWYVIKQRRWRGFLGDTTQMGGDVIVDRAGVIRYLRQCDDPTDRPLISELLTVLEGV